MIAPGDIGGLVLAGGAGSRMGGADKGLLPYAGTALARHAALRLQAQVGKVAISANRNRDAYQALGFEVIADEPIEAGQIREESAHAGPLAGMLAGLRHCRTPWLVIVPCDAPLFPGDLVARLTHAADDTRAVAAVAHAPDGEGQLLAQPTFCLLHRSLEPALAAALRAGQRKAGRWLASVGAAAVPFADGAGFANANTPAELERLPVLAEAASIRRLVATDLPYYKALRDEMLAAHPEAFTSDAASERAKRPDAYLDRLGLDRHDGGHLTLGGWLDADRLVGAISLEREERVKTRHIGHVIGMMVREPMRRTGLGRALLEATVGEARRVGLEMLTLSVTAGNDAAVRLYETSGFTTYGRLQRALRIGRAHHDKLLMVLDL